MSSFSLLQRKLSSLILGLQIKCQQRLPTYLFTPMFTLQLPRPLAGPVAVLSLVMCTLSKCGVCINDRQSAKRDCCSVEFKIAVESDLKD